MNDEKFPLYDPENLIEVSREEVSRVIDQAKQFTADAAHPIQARLGNFVVRFFEFIGISTRNPVILNDPRRPKQ